jgi:hypothetical protein
MQCAPRRARAVLARGSLPLLLALLAAALLPLTVRADYQELQDDDLVYGQRGTAERNAWGPQVEWLAGWKESADVLASPA